MDLGVLCCWHFRTLIGGRVRLCCTWLQVVEVARHSQSICCTFQLRQLSGGQDLVCERRFAHHLQKPLVEPANLFCAHATPGFVADNLAVFQYDSQQLQVLGSRRVAYISCADG